MNRFKITVRRALDLARRLTPARRAIPMLGLASALTFSTLGPPAPAGAADPGPDSRDLVGRIHVVVKEVYIWDDRDWGDGEFRFSAHLGCYAKPTSCFGYPTASVDNFFRNLSAAGGQTIPVNAVLPQSTDLLHPKFPASPEAGYPLYNGHTYLLKFSMHEWDDFGANDRMGERHIVLTPENGWGIGTHRLRSTRPDGWGDFEIEFEVRLAPLPDLQALHQITVHDLPGGAKQRVCMVVHNREAVPAGPFEVALRVDGVVPQDGRAAAPGLAPGSNHDACVETALPTSGQHTLAAVVDEADAVLEVSEANNVYQEPYQGTGRPAASAPAQTPAPASSAALPDLIVAAIKVNGRVPDGKDDCKDGKNAVTVVVKNQGTEKAGDFAVRLVVDDDRGDALEQTLGDDLDAGKEVPVTFGGVRLKKGPNGLMATAHAMTGTGITESNEGNNTLKATATC